VIDEVKRRAKEHFLSEYVSIIESGEPIFFEEKRDGGEGKATFQSNKPCVRMKAKDQSPLLWAFSNRKCAEGALLTISNDECHLHIVELKSKLSQAEWSKARDQLSGMYLTALATCRVLGISEFNSVICYIGYKQNAMSPENSADPVLIKTFVGTRNPIGKNDEWEAEKMQLPLNAEATIIKAQRDCDQNVDFGGI
jgi:hypothetical protein